MIYSDIAIPPMFQTRTIMELLKPGTSVIVPCFNAERCIARTIDSLLTQSVPPNEIIVVDDGSQDGTADIVSKYSSAVVKLIRQVNQGAAVARHTGTLHAAYDIVLFVDAGDTCPPEKIRIMRDALLANPGSICVFGECMNLARKTTKEKSLFTGGPLNGAYTLVDDPLKVLLARSWPLASAMNLAVRRPFAIMGSDIGPFYKAGNDHALQLNLSKYGSFIHVAAITQEFEFLDNGLSMSFGSDQQMAYSLLAAIAVYNSLEDKNKYRRLLSRKVSHFWPEIAYNLWNHENRELRNMIIKSGLRYGSIPISFRSFLWHLAKEEKRGRIIKNRILRLIAKSLSFRNSRSRETEAN